MHVAIFCIVHDDAYTLLIDELFYKSKNWLQIIIFHYVYTFSYCKYDRGIIVYVATYVSLAYVIVKLLISTVTTPQSKPVSYSVVC